jgi:tRNA A-37 threonylcarbamoyl transferase component Bud32
LEAEQFRRCPSCAAESAPQVLRCACGALLTGVDLLSRHPPAEAVAAPAAPVAPGNTALVCAHEDCGQPNPQGSVTCLYCNRALQPAGLSSAAQLHSLISLPGTLKDRFRILRPLPTQGAEAELLLVQQVDGGPELVAKIYRHGVQPRADVRERLARVDTHFCVALMESGTQQGYAYEVMEYCTRGSLRELLRKGTLKGDALQALVRELASAIAAVHAVGLLHRDLKPENILLRAVDPLDLVLTDFGISSVIDATQRFTSTARTLPYASPESLSGVIDGKTDYWSLGIILLEASQGQHPFAQLSEAVILHHLTTRGIDLTGVRDSDLRKLLRGLLLRDPQQRWGDAEIRRWLAQDSGLAEPQEASGVTGFSQPYHLGQDVCHTPAQLAVALARNWSAGCADIANGQLLTWFREVPKDQNAVRLLLELRHESGLPVDVQLLRLILHLAPGMPPVWQGEPIGLRSVLLRANLALKGNSDAAHWLAQLQHYQVLQTCAQAGNPECADLVLRWGQAYEQFDQAWDDGMALLRQQAARPEPGTYADVHQLLYGKSDPDRPALAGMHARLLAIAYDPQWAERLRRRLLAELAGLLVYCPWLGQLGDPLTLAPAPLLVLEALLPQARKLAEQQQLAEARLREADAAECAALNTELQAVLAALRHAARASLLLPAACATLAAELERYFDLVAKIRASGRSDLPWQELRAAAARRKTVAAQMREAVHSLAEQRAENAGWLSQQVLIFVVLAMLLLPMIFGRSTLGWLSALLAGVAAWRLLPVYSQTRKIRGLASRL